MRSRRAFLRLTGGAAGAAFATARYGIDEVAALTARPRPAAGHRRSGRRRGLLARHPERLHARPHADQSQQRQQLPQPDRGPRGLQALPRLLEPGAGLPPRPDRAEHRNGRRRLAAQFGCDPEEMAITRNSSESLQIAQNGLDLKPGDEVVTTEQDYGRMLTTWDQRARRDKITVNKINFPVPTTGEDLIGLLEGAITPRTKVLHFCHITNLTGQLFPVQQPRPHGPAARHHHHRRRRARRRRTSRSSCATSRWITTAPACTSGCWRRPAPGSSTCAAIASPRRGRCRRRRRRRRQRHPQVRGGRHLSGGDQGGDQRGAGLPPGDRHRAQGGAAALPDDALGQRAEDDTRIKIHSNLAEGQTWGLACVSIDGVDSNKLVTHLWDAHRIVITSIGHDNPDDAAMSYRALRVTPNIYTPLEEVDTFVGGDARRHQERPAGVTGADTRTENAPTWRLGVAPARRLP